MRMLTQAEFDQRMLENFGDKLDTSGFVYDGNRSKGTVRCPKHGGMPKTAGNLLNGEGCKKCYNESRIGVYDDDIVGFIAKARAIHGNKYSYDKAVYCGKRKKLTITCTVHGDFSQAAQHHLAGHGCEKCGHESRIGVYDDDIVGFIAKARDVHSHAYGYDKAIYRGACASLTITCQKHGDFPQAPREHLSGHGCEKCRHESRIGVYDDDIVGFIAKARAIHGNKYSYDKAVYCGAMSHLTITCQTHGDFPQAPQHHLGAHGCPSCSGVGPSKGQRELHEFVNNIVQSEMEVRLNGSKHRLDVFVPKFSLAIEYHGLIWHSTRYQDDPRKDFTKHKLAETQGIRTIHIYEDEWATKRPIVERTLLSALGELSRIFARNTMVISVDKEKACEFFNAHHLQGVPKATVFIGLEKDAGLVACMAFGMARSVRTNTDSGLWELQRYAATATVVGGASRLLKAFLKMKLCHTLISYSDERLFTGNMYSALGFNLEHVTKPDYCYVTSNFRKGRMHKSKFQRKHLAKMFENFDPKLTEVENCRNNGYYQLFDCGKKKWSLSCI